MRTSELIGTHLDYWVARAENHEIKQAGNAMWIVNNGFSAYIGGDHMPHYSPSTNWAQGGFIFEKHDGAVHRAYDPYRRNQAMFSADIGDGLKRYRSTGPTYLVAIMRAFVGFTYGDEVPDA